MTYRGKVSVSKAISVPKISADLWGLGSEELADGPVDSIKKLKLELGQFKDDNNGFYLEPCPLYFNGLFRGDCLPANNFKKVFQSN